VFVRRRRPHSTHQAYACFFIDRVQRLKDARAEAAKEIEQYKQAKDEEFRAFESSVRSTTQSLTARQPDFPSYRFSMPAQHPARSQP